MKSSKQLTTGALAAILILSSLSLTACGNATTLARVGNVLQQIVVGVDGEISALESAGALSPEKVAQLRRQAQAVRIATNALASYLNSLGTIDSTNKPQVIAKIAEAAARLAALLQNPDVLKLPPDTLFVKVLNYANITLQQLSIVLAAIKTPTPTAGQAEQRGVPTNTIKVTLPPVPKGAEKYFPK